MVRLFLIPVPDTRESTLLEIKGGQGSYPWLVRLYFKFSKPIAFDAVTNPLNWQVNSCQGEGPGDGDL